MDKDTFEKIVAEEFPGAIPERFRKQIENVAFLVEDQPSLETRREEGLGSHETLLGLYRGVPHTARGDFYGVGGTLPDTITLFQKPIEFEAEQLQHSHIRANVRMSDEEAVRRVVRETIWHEVAHHFGMNEHEVREREEERRSE
ncbi:MAG TPA: metallopeptidase family protein [Candidatus Paceibacterota bacterium]|nr:metallopeptidase family protein [Candidatus Paceibacterota bacterium]